MTAHQPARERPERKSADRYQEHDVVATLLPHQDPQHHAAHPQHGQDRAAAVDLPVPRVGNVLDESDLHQHDRDHDGLQQEADAPGQVCGDEAAEERPDPRRDRCCCADERIGLLLCRAFEIAVDEGLHRRQQERGAEAADDRPEDDDRRQVLGEGHRHSAGRVRQQTHDISPLATEEVADLAADQDERSGDQRLERDRALDGAHRGVEVPDDRRDRHVHQRRVDDEHEHGRRQEQRQPRVTRFLRWNAGGRPPVTRCHPTASVRP